MFFDSFFFELEFIEYKIKFDFYYLNLVLHLILPFYLNMFYTKKFVHPRLQLLTSYLLLKEDDRFFDLLEEVYFHSKTLDSDDDKDYLFDVILSTNHSIRLIPRLYNWCTEHHANKQGMFSRLLYAMIRCRQTQFLYRPSFVDKYIHFQHEDSYKNEDGEIIQISPRVELKWQFSFVVIKELIRWNNVDFFHSNQIDHEITLDLFQDICNYKASSILTTPIVQQFIQTQLATNGGLEDILDRFNYTCESYLDAFPEQENYWTCFEEEHMMKSYNAFRYASTVTGQDSFLFEFWMQLLKLLPILNVQQVYLEDTYATLDGQKAHYHHTYLFLLFSRQSWKYMTEKSPGYASIFQDIITFISDHQQHKIETQLSSSYVSMSPRHIVHSQELFDSFVSKIRIQHLGNDHLDTFLYVFVQNERFDYLVSIIIHLFQQYNQVQTWDSYHRGMYENFSAYAFAVSNIEPLINFIASIITKIQCKYQDANKEQPIIQDLFTRIVHSQISKHVASTPNKETKKEEESNYLRSMFATLVSVCCKVDMPTLLHFQHDQVMLNLHPQEQGAILFMQQFIPGCESIGSNQFILRYDSVQCFQAYIHHQTMNSVSSFTKSDLNVQDILKFQCSKILCHLIETQVITIPDMTQLLKPDSFHDSIVFDVLLKFSNYFELYLSYPKFIDIFIKSSSQRIRNSPGAIQFILFCHNKLNLEETYTRFQCLLKKYESVESMLLQNIPLSTDIVKHILLPYITL